jgi:Mce-associated membrane protein
VSGGARQKAAETTSARVNEDETPRTAADVRALAEEAEAQAAEAEALAAAARARALAIQLRRQAELVEAAKDNSTTETLEGDPADAIQTEADVTREVDSQEIRFADEAVTEADTDAPVLDIDEPAPGGRPSGQRRRLNWSTIAMGQAILVVIAALVGSGYMIKEHHDAVRQRERAAEFAAAARQGVTTLTSLDFKNAKQGVQRIADNSTGSFRDDFLKMADDFANVVKQSDVVSRGNVAAAAVDLDTLTDNSALVLVASTSEVIDAAGAKQDPRDYRLMVTVTRDGGQLKISKVEFVP